MVIPKPEAIAGKYILSAKLISLFDTFLARLLSCIAAFFRKRIKNEINQSQRYIEYP